MATALQQQLANIAANSTHQLDLKAQKAFHSKSLLFEPRDAATQSFETIYQICYEGFEQLCALDSRFAAFGRNIFSEQSKSEDRTRMTKKENGELDEVLERFMGLVGGRLILKPAMKAVEWLVRRFRVQEYNTECVLLTFLPYHTSHIFPTLLSILPGQLPASFRFLQPYKASLQSPPRNVILSAAVGNQNFFSAFNNYTLQIANAKHHSSILLGFWASITAQAVNGMIDTSRSGRDSIRKQREEDLLLRVLPVLQSALCVKDIPELYLGACMIITILASKASLEDKALDALMEAVAGSWTDETLADGMSCLALVAEEKQQVTVPITVAKAIGQNDHALSYLISSAKSQRVSKLAAAIAVGCVQLAYKKKDASHIIKVKQLLDIDILADHYTRNVLEKLLSTLNRLREIDLASDVAKSISQILMAFSDEPERLKLLEEAAQQSKMSLAALQLTSLEFHNNTMDIDQLSIDDAEPEPTNKNTESAFETLFNSLPQLPETCASLLDANSQSSIFESYSDAFQSCLSSRNRTERFLALPQLHQNEAFSRPEFFSLLMRVWSTNSTTAAKAAALHAIRAKLEETEHLDNVVHLQSLLPYLMVALSDPSTKVRQAGVQLCSMIYAVYERQPEISSSPSEHDVKTTAANVYGPDLQVKHQLQQNDVSKLLKSVLVPALEDAALDADYMKYLIVDVLNDKQEGRNELSKTLRSDICAFFASHLATPVYRVKLALLDILSAVGKAATATRSELILPFARNYFNLSESELSPNLQSEGIAIADMDKAVLKALTHRSAAEIQLIEDVGEGRIGPRESLIPWAFSRISSIFASAKGAQIEIAEWLLELSMRRSTSGSGQSNKDEAFQTLRDLALPTEVLAFLVEALPKATDLQEQPAAKKRRTSGNDSSQAREIDHSKVQDAIRHITLVLELVESSDPKQHPQLLRGLFHTLSELHHFKTMLGSELVYTFQILLGCILSVVEGLRTNPKADVDRTVIRTDLIVECVRTTSSTQIHNTALLLVSSLASWAPELVLHCVMPLFTFMSSTLLRQSDSFSTHVMDKTVERIVPPLAASLKKKGKSLVVGASELLLSFTAAFEHIPLHRQAALFTHLIETLGAEETLFAVLAMLIERYCSDTSISSFVVDLTNEFSGLTTVNAAKQYLDLISDTMKPKRHLADVLLSFSDKDVTEKLESQQALLAGLASLLRNATLRDRLATELAREDDDSGLIQNTYASLLEHTMQLNRDIDPTSSLKSPASALLLSVLGLMPTKDFIQSSAQLMQTGTDQTRQQVFRALETRVSDASAGDTATRKIFLDVLPNCGVFLREDQPVATRQAAVSCIDQICEKYGKTDRDAALAVAQQVAGESALGSEDVSLRIISILCLASMIEILGDDCIPILPNVLGRVLKFLKDDSKQTAQDGAHLNVKLQAAGFALLNSTLDHLPWMLADQHLDQALFLAAQAARIEPPIDAVQEFGTLVASKVGATQLFTSIHQTLSNLLNSGVKDEESLQYHLGVLHATVRHHSKATTTKNARLIFNILLEAFDLRRTLDPHHQQPEQWDDLFELINGIGLDVTLKLNDATFRPFFMTFVEWATKPTKETGDDSALTLRQISLYSFSLTLFNQLQSIVTSYAGFLLENASEVLKKPSSGAHWERERINLVLRTLSSSFTHDQDDFWQTPAHFDAVAMPLVDQLQAETSSGSVDQVITTISDLAAAARSPDHLKALNAVIMAHLRSRDAAVRLAAVKCERSLTEKLAVDWLDLLPEMLPMISELHEDDDEEVERETLRWAREIEEITGESLDPMLA